MQCPNCQKDNPANSRFCQHCGTTLPADMAIASPQQMSPTPSPARPSSMQTAPPRPRSPAPIGQLGSQGTSPLNIWGPFAGYGQRGRHVSWLLDNVGLQADALHAAIDRRFEDRAVPGTGANWKRLTAQGLIVEQRPFFLVKRGISTVALYIGQFGNDLYISQVTYAKGPLSNLRVALAGLLTLFYFWFQIFYPSAVANRLGSLNFLSGSLDIPYFLLCLVGPLGFVATLLFWLMVLYSVFKLLREKDPVAILRKPPNEFEADDTMALEKAVEETVRQSLDTINVERSRMPVAQERSFQRRRLI